jgi:CubicO group peptidase (beta-lactamase class C family)
MSARNALFLVLAVTGVLTAQTTPEVAAKADAYIKTAGIQGCVLLAKGGKIILAKGYGLANVELNVANTPKTKFRLGSITKQFTAAAILQLQEKGKLRVGDPISKYVPGGPAAWNGITIHHLLTHTSGIPSYTDEAGYEAHMRERAGAPLDFIKRFRDLPLEFKPGERFHYDNSGYFLLGVIVEQVSGVTYENYLQKNIFERLGMTDTGYDWPTAILKDRALGYSKAASGEEINAEFLDMGHPYAAGSLYSTVLDLYKWDRALYTTKVLSAQSLESVFTPNKYDWAEGIKYGYGWGIAQVHGHKAVGHGGGINGFSTVIWRAIEEDATSIVLSNNDRNSNIGKAGKELLELLLSSN